MSSSDRRAFLARAGALAGVIAGATALAGCGFAPIYGPRGAGGALRGQVLADEPDTRFGYAFVARIEDRLGRAGDARWALGYRIETRQTAVGIDSENAITRYNITGTVAWELRPLDSDEVVLSDATGSFTGYSATGTAVSAFTARRDAEDRLMAILADQLVAQLFARAGELPP